MWQDEADEDRRRFLQALIQVASAVHKAVNDVAPRGAVRLLDAAREKLAGLGDVFLGADLSVLREGMERCRSEIARQLEDSGHCELASDFIPTLRQVAASPAFHKQPKERIVPKGAASAWFDKGLDTYRAGDFFEAHELWEELWRDAPPGFDRQFVQGLIQVAAAMHKIKSHEKPKPAARLLGRAIDKLTGAPQGYRSIDTVRLLREARHAKTLLEAGALPDDKIPAIERVLTSSSA